jgi:hypothetical protein
LGRSKGSTVASDTLSHDAVYEWVTNDETGEEERGERLDDGPYAGDTHTCPYCESIDDRVIEKPIHSVRTLYFTEIAEGYGLLSSMMRPKSQQSAVSRKASEIASAGKRPYPAKKQ